MKIDFFAIIIVVLSLLVLWNVYLSSKALDEWRTSWDSDFKPRSFLEILFRKPPKP